MARRFDGRRRIAALVDSCPVSATRQVVRYFDHPGGVQDDIGTNDQEDNQGQAGRRQPFGWHIDLATLELLHAIRAELDVDG